MNNETFNMSIRRFLKMVGVGSQHEIEQAVMQAVAAGNLKGHETLPVKMTLVIDRINLEISFDDVIRLDDTTA